MSVDRARESEHRPGPAVRRGRAAWLLVLAVWLVFSTVLGLFYAAVPPSADQALYDYIGWRIVEGDTPYVDVAELNWPGGMLLHAAAIGLFGNSFHTWRIFDYLYLLATLALVFWVVGALADRRTALVAVVLYQLLYVTGGVWFSGQRDIMAAPFLLLSAFAAMRGLDRARWAWAFLAGAALAPAMILKPTLGAMAMVLGGQAVWAWRAGRGVPDRDPAVSSLSPAGSGVTPGPRNINLGRLLAHAAGMAAGLGLGLGAYVILAAGWGFLDAWWVLAFQFNQAVYAQDSVAVADMIQRLGAWVLPSWHWLLVAAVAGVVVLVRGGHRRLLWVALAVLGTTAISVAVQQKGFGYHLGPALLGLALLASPFLARCVSAVLAHPFRPGSVRVWAAGVVCLVVVAGLGSKLRREYSGIVAWYAGARSRTALLRDYEGGDPGITMADATAAARYLEAHTSADQTVLLWGRSVFTLYLARRASPTRFINAYMLWAAGPGFERSRAWTREFARDLAEKPPAFIVLTRDPKGGHVWVEEGAASVDLLLRVLARDYHKVAQFGGLELYGHDPDRRSAVEVN